MSERTEAIQHGAKPEVLDEYFMEYGGRLFHKSCCCGCGRRVGPGSLVVQGTTFIFRDIGHFMWWIAENRERVGDASFIRGTTFVFENDEQFTQWIMDDIEVLMGDWGWIRRMAYKAHSRLITWLQDDRHAWGVVVVALVLVAYFGLR